MIFVQPSQFFPSWDINIKVPLIIRNSLPFDISVKSFDIIDYCHDTDTSESLTGD